MATREQVPMGTAVSPQRLADAEALLAQGVTEGLYTHAVYALARGGRVAGRRAFGAATLDSIFDLASLTKPLATATLCLQLAEQGRLHLRQSPSRFFQDIYGPLPHLEDVQIRHLLTHTSGLPPIPRWPSDTGGAERTTLIRSALETPLLRPPGTGFTYSDAGYILLGEIVAHVAGQPLPQAFAAGVAAPLGLTATGFCPPTAQAERLVPTERGLALGTVHDPRARDLGGAAGHAGLFGTVDDVLTYAEALRTGGPPVLSRAATARMHVSQIDGAVGAQSYGWFCAGNDFLPQGDLLSDRALGHSGFTGTLLTIDPEFDLSIVLLTNRVINTDEDGSRFLRWRRFWLNMVAAALE